MVVSLSILSIVFLAMGSVMLLSTKAIPDPDAPANLNLDAADALQQMASELETANSVIFTFGNNGIAFTVPDRNGDDVDESIVYRWNGVPGSPLLRRYNGGTWVMVLPSVYEFNLTYDLKSVPQPDALVESAEVELSSHIDVGNFNDYSVKQNDWIGQYFVPSNLPADAVGWSVTRVLFEAKNVGAIKGQTLVQLRPALAGNLPDVTVLEEHVMLESALSSGYTWQPFTFSSIRDRAPNEGLCLVLQWVTDADAAEIRVDSIAGSGFLTTNDSGTTWSYDPAQSMNFYVYGTYSTSVPQPPISLLRSVTITLNPGQDPASRVRTAVITLNQPQMP